MATTYDDARSLSRRPGHEADAADPTRSRIYRLRTNAGYQNTLRALKWRAIPAVIGCGALIALALLGIYVPSRLAISFR